MKVLVFAPHSYAELPFAEWLSELDAEYFLLAPKRTRKSYAAFSQMYPFQRYWSNPDVERTGLELARSHNFDAVLVKDEWDILRAARIREAAGIPGQNVDSALAFRDKMKMKTALRAGGVAVSNFAALNTPEEAWSFVQENGYPVVIKPVAGVLGAFTRIVRNADELATILAVPFPEAMMIEAFVEGCLYHADGLRDRDGLQFVFASRYVNSCLSYQDNQFSGSIRLADSDPLALRLSTFTEQMLRALPDVQDGRMHAFHAEIFVTPDDRLVCCEIACRTGGGRIVDQTVLEFGVHLDREWWRGQMGLPSSLGDARNTSGKRFAHMFIPHQGVGTVQALPETGHFPWAHSEKFYVTQGEVLEVEPGRRMNLASCILEGVDDAELDAKMRIWNDWVLAHTVITHDPVQ